LSGRRTWSKQQRLLREREFASFTYPQAPWRASRRWIAMSALILPTPSLSNAAAPAAPAGASLARARLRFGITVSRRQARRAVARNAVKRVLRESARHAADELSRLAPSQGVDVLLRLKAPLPEPASAGWSLVKQQLRREADGLMAQLCSHLRAQARGPAPGAGGAGPDPSAPPQLAQSAGSAAPVAPGTEPGLG
jgi:ribonuclease P protein component